jgi:hypothetical protein
VYIAHVCLVPLAIDNSNVAVAVNSIVCIAHAWLAQTTPCFVALHVALLRLLLLLLLLVL